MTILAIETSGKTFSVALSREKELLGEIYWNCGFKHSEKLIASIEWLLKNLEIKLEEINKIAVSTGPGSFTGIRVGLACAKTLSQNLSIPIAAFDVLDILSKSLDKDGRLVFPAIDALREEVFIKVNGKIEIISIEALVKKLNSIKTGVTLTGSAVLKYGPQIIERLQKKDKLVLSILHYPRAGVLALMAENIKGKSYKHIKPLYIRRTWAEDNQVKSKR